jgi:polar amino acid transport system substrate-binding protein
VIELSGDGVGRRPRTLRSMRALASVLAITLLAGVGGYTGGSHSGSAPAPSTTVDRTLAAQVPAPVRAAGVLVVATDPRYEPAEFRPEGKAVAGFDVDLFNAVAGKLALRTEWKAVDFDEIIPGVAAGTYQVGVSSFSVRTDREAQATMVSYFTAGTQWAARVDAVVDPEGACGKKVAVQLGTSQVAQLAASTAACAAAGQPVLQVDEYVTQQEVTAAVVSRKDDAMLADSAVCGYEVKQAKGALTLVGRIYHPVRYGYVLPPGQPEFGAAVAQALRRLMAEGTYGSILAKWGVDGGGISDPIVNPPA